MNASSYTIGFTPAGLAYVRQVLGARPYDEVAPLIASLEVQRAEQDQARAAQTPPAEVRPLRPVEPAAKDEGARPAPPEAQPALP